MAKWIKCGRCGHVFENSLNRCPECSKYTINSKIIITSIGIISVCIIAIIGFILGLLENSAIPVVNSSDSSANQLNPNDDIDNNNSASHKKSDISDSSSPQSSHEAAINSSDFSDKSHKSDYVSSITASESNASSKKSTASSEKSKESSSVQSNSPAAQSSASSVSSVDSSKIEKLERQIFQQLYKNEEAEYLFNISKQLTVLNTELSEWQQKASDNYVRYTQEKQSIRNRFEAMGMLNSGAYNGALETLEQEYKSTSAEYSEKINSIKKQIAELNEEYNNPDVNKILTQLANNNDMTFEQAVEKYNKYILN